MKKKDLVPVVRSLLLKKAARTQEEICQILKKQGYQINQTKVSRLLRKIGVVKVKDDDGKVVYWLPKEPPPPSLSNLANNLVIDVVANEALIVIHTTPGAASVVARMIDYLGSENEILGTIAGDDTIFVATKSIGDVKQVYKKIKNRLGFT